MVTPEENHEEIEKIRERLHAQGNHMAGLQLGILEIKTEMKVRSETSKDGKTNFLAVASIVVAVLSLIAAVWGRFG